MGGKKFLIIEITRTIIYLMKMDHKIKDYTQVIYKFLKIGAAIVKAKVKINL
jgi:hypothetical protein